MDFVGAPGAASPWLAPPSSSSTMVMDVDAPMGTVEVFRRRDPRDSVETGTSQGEFSRLMPWFPVVFLDGHYGND